MNANRVPGLGPSDSNKPVDRQSQREAAQRVEKVGEVDPDEQARQQRFRQIMESNTESEEDAAKTMPLPSPFDLSAGEPSSTFEMDEIPNASYSEPPTLTPTTQLPLSSEDLPKSKQFWQSTNLPDEPIGKTKYEEKKPNQASAGKKEANFSIAGPPGKPATKSSSTKASESSGKKKNTGEETPEAQYWTPEHGFSQTSPASGKTSGKKEPKDLISAFDEESAQDELTLSKKGSPRGDFTLHEKKSAKEDKEKKSAHEKKETLQIVSPTLPELPAVVQPAAIAATQSISAYLRPESIPLFYQMIGSIIVMSTPPGISRTEFILNNPAFSNSKFFGATVELIKYSTAPDSYNIRLSGSNEAVAAFNQNLPNLMAAFQTGHFSFRIGRIDAEYANDRPVLRRKNSTEEDGNGESKQDPRR